MRLVRLSAIGAVIAGSIVAFGAAPASAQTCEVVMIGGTWGNAAGSPSYTYCQDYTGGLCHGESDGADPQLHVYAYVCVPDPVTAP